MLIHTERVTACNGKCFKLCPDFMGVPFFSGGNLHILQQCLSGKIPLWADMIVGSAANDAEEGLDTRASLQSTELMGSVSKAETGKRAVCVQD